MAHIELQSRFHTEQNMHRLLIRDYTRDYTQMQARGTPMSTLQGPVIKLILTLTITQYIVTARRAASPSTAIAKSCVPLKKKTFLHSIGALYTWISSIPLL